MIRGVERSCEALGFGVSWAVLDSYGCRSPRLRSKHTDIPAGILQSCNCKLFEKDELFCTLLLKQKIFSPQLLLPFLTLNPEH